MTRQAQTADCRSGRPIRVMRIIARLNIGGPAIHVALLTGALRDEQFWTTLVTGQIGEHEGDMTYLAHDLGIEPIIISTMQREIAPLSDLRALVDLIRLIRRERPEVVHTHTAKAGLIGRLAAYVCRVPVIVHTFHGHVFRGYFGPLRTQMFLWLERAAARLSDAVLTISDGLRDDLLAFRIAPPTRIRVLPLGLNLAPFAGADALQGALRNELGISTEAPLIGIIGRLVPIKNHDLFFNAAQIIRSQITQARFVVVGGGERLDELKALAERLNLSDCMYFTGWRDDLPAIYADLDALVISSRNEGTPVSIIEAMAAGVPVIATAVGGVPDVLGGGAYGELVPPDDAGALAQAVIHILASDQSARLAEARRQALAQYGVERLVSDIRSLYTELLAQKGIDAGSPVPDGHPAEDRRL